MANYHVNSTALNPIATPAAPYDTWEKAAANLTIVDGLMAAGDICYVHPSHVETQVGSNNFTNGLITNPCNIICGTPNTSLSPASVGITALQATATVASTNAALGFSGNVYVYGIVFKMTTSSSSGILTLASTAGTVQTFEECELHNANTSTSAMVVGSATVAGDGLIVFNSVHIRYGNSSQQVRINKRVIMNNVSFISGTTTPVALFQLGTVTADNGRLEVNGMDCSTLGTTFNVFSDVTKAPSVGRVRGARMPASWTGAVNGSPDVGNTFELLNYSIGNSSAKNSWMTDDQGDAKSETTIVKTGGASDGTTAYSIALASSANCAYPASIYRSPPIRKRVASGAPTTIGVSFAYNGATAMTTKEAWIEVEYLGTSGYALSTVYSSCPNFITSAGTYTSASETWTGFTNGVTAGPNEGGNTTWRSSKFYFPGVTFAEDGDVVVTVCIAKPSWTIFVNAKID